jgi:hypothetical protein
MTCGGNLIRTITEIKGDMVAYADQLGGGHCTQNTFVKKCYRVATDEDVLNQPYSQVPEVEINHRATNEVLHSYLTLQNQLDSWIRMLKQTAEYNASDLTASQKEAVEKALRHSKLLSKRLQVYQAGLIK